MKINFLEITAQNFLSYGNSPTTLNLTKDPFTLIVGKNGVGKSTLVVDAIAFAKDGKIQRKGITQDKVINNINKKNCVVTLKFNVNGKKKYTIKRGLKPSFLELYEDGNSEPMDSRSSKTLVQEEIDRIIPLDTETMRNLCVLSINTRKPFVDLSPEETRRVTENILGIGVFSRMLKEVKDRIKTLKQKALITDKDLALYAELVKDGKDKLEKYKQLKETFGIEKASKIKRCKADIDIFEKEKVEKIRNCELLIANFEKDKKEKIDKCKLAISVFDKERAERIKNCEQVIANFEKDKKEKIDDLQFKLTDIEKELKRKTVGLDLLQYWDNEAAIKNLEILKSEGQKLIESSYKIKGDTTANLGLIGNEESDIKFLMNNDICPTCSSKLTEKHKKKELDDIEKKIKDLQQKNLKNESKNLTIQRKLEVKEAEKVKIERELSEYKDKTYELEKSISNLDNNVLFYKKGIEDLKSDTYRGVTIGELERDKYCGVTTEEIENEKYRGVTINEIKADKYRGVTVEDIEKETIEDKLSGLVNKKQIKEHVEKYKLLKVEKKQNVDDHMYNDLLKSILSDNGVKSEIIKKDIPYLNFIIAKYLKSFGQTFTVEFDDTFDVVVKGFHKKGLAFHSLSEGQKKRVDLAILLAFIDLTKRKNSINTNILCLDEIFDTSLDSEGVEDFTEILNQKVKENQLDNIFIISHKQDLNLPEAKKIEVTMDNMGFSKIKEI